MTRVLRLDEAQYKTLQNRRFKACTSVQATTPLPKARKARGGGLKRQGGGSERECKSCGKVFTPDRVGGRHKGEYCSKACTHKDRLKQRKCETCGVEYEALTHENTRFCSKGCVRRGGENNPSWRGGKITTPCVKCGEEIIHFPSQNRKYCSRKCRGAANASGSGNPNWRGGAPEYLCKNCGKQFSTYQVEPMYCSKACWTKHQFADRSHARWGTKWGRSRVGKRSDLNGQFFRSGWEANYARYLNWRKLPWRYEAETFEFPVKRGTRFYTPDFKITDGELVEYHEVKGWRHPKGETALRRMAKYHPHIRITVIDQKAYRAIEKIKALIPGWE